MNIAQISNLSGRGANLLSKILVLAKIFRFAEFKPDPSSHLIIKDADAFTGSAARAEGAAAQKDAQEPITTA